jgi:thiamine-phosphate pyrophosphorylase
MSAGQVCAVTARRRLAPDARTPTDEVTRLRAFADDLIAAGVDLLQIREPDLDAGPLVELVRGAVATAAGTRTRVLVSDRADVALAAGASGVHLRADGLPAGRVRTLPGGRAWLVGRSAHQLDELTADHGLDYWLFGTIYASASKPGLLPLAGPEGLARAAAAAGRPLLAIGGITPARAAACAAAGAAGVAGIGVFLPEGLAPGALGPARAVAALRAALG